jgi:L-ribulose-5-phosphate 4-epimerase
VLEELRKMILAANKELQTKQLALYTWGNASGIDRERGLVVIKPSGVPYEELTAEMMVIVDLEEKVVEGTLNPSSDTPTHMELYRSFPGIGGVVHTHSPYATAWAQACQGIPCFGTTHADHFHGEIPCTRPLTWEEISRDYELATGRVIAEHFKNRSCLDVPGVLVAHHGPFTWGRDPLQAAEHSVILEEVARMALLTHQLNASMAGVPQALLDRHFQRKHGANSYYGQKRVRLGV